MWAFSWARLACWPISSWRCSQAPPAEPGFLDAVVRVTKPPLSAGSMCIVGPFCGTFTEGALLADGGLGIGIPGFPAFPTLGIFNFGIAIGGFILSPESGFRVREIGRAHV